MTYTDRTELVVMAELYGLDVIVMHWEWRDEAHALHPWVHRLGVPDPEHESVHRHWRDVTGLEVDTWRIAIAELKGLRV